MYVIKAHRNKGIGSLLYRKAEEIADNLGCNTVYNWIHPNNDRIISFLSKRGYDTLNLIEIKKTINTGSTSVVIVGDNEFKY